MTEQTFVAHLRDSGQEVPFPVVFPDEESTLRSWRWDAEHSPYPLTPLSQEFSRGRVGPAMAAESLGAPPSPPMPNVLANGYRYAGVGGGYGSDAPEYVKTVSEMAPRVDELWERGWRREIEEKGRQMAGFDYTSLALQELIERVKATVDVIRDNMVMMFRAAHLVSFSRGQLVQFCQAYVGEAAESLVTDLLQGTQTESFDSGADLWNAAQILASHLPALAHLRDQPDAQGLAGLSGVEGGAEFRGAFEAWLERYGNRNGTFGELAEPTWREDPRVPISMALQYVDAPDPRISRARAVEVREQLQSDFEKRLSTRQEVAAFRTLLTNADPYLAVRESRDHATVLAFTAIRVPTLEIAGRLVQQGSIENPEDIFFLRFEDLEAAAADPSADFKSLFTERRQDYLYWRNVAPPATIGGDADSAPGNETLIRAVAASAGIVTATAHIVLTLTDAASLSRGEVLVTRSTTPAWTPLFGTVAAVVTEGGGMLSHCAIVAREYGIPAVVGAAGATLRIRDGSRITVDGTKGRVILEDSV